MQTIRMVFLRGRVKFGMFCSGVVIRVVGGYTESTIPPVLGDVDEARCAV